MVGVGERVGACVGGGSGVGVANDGSGPSGVGVGVDVGVVDGVTLEASNGVDVVSLVDVGEADGD